MSCNALVSFYMLWVGVTQTRRRLLFKHWGSTTPEEEHELFRRSCGIGKDGDGGGSRRRRRKQVVRVTHVYVVGIDVIGAGVGQQRVELYSMSIV